MNPKHTNKEIRSGHIKELRVAKTDDGKNTVTGYAIVYNSPSVDLGGFVEIVAPGALTRTLTENPDVLCLRDHDCSLLLGRTLANTLTLTDDNIGLRFECTLPNTTAADDLAESMARGDIDACSFMMSVVNDTWSQDAQGNIIRTLLDIDLSEVSIVSFPAYPDTSAALRSAPAEIRSQLQSRVADAPAAVVVPILAPAKDESRERRRRQLDLKVRLFARTCTK